MVKDTDNRTLILSVIMGALIPFPLIIAGFVSIFGEADHLCFCYGTALAIISWLLGQFFGYLLKKSPNKGLLYVIRLGVFIFCGGLIFLAELYLFTFEEQSLSVMFTPVAAILWCWFGFRFGSGQSLMPISIIGVYCVEAVFMYPITDSLEEKGNLGKAAILVITAVMIVCGVLYFNRRQLNILSNMGKNRNRPVSGATLRFNTKTSLMFSGIILVMFFFAGFGARWLWEAVKAIVRFILYILSGNPFEQGEDETQGGTPFIPEEPHTQLDTSLFWYAALFVALIMVIVILYKPIIELIRRVIEDFKRRLGKFVVADEEAQYIDTYLSTETKAYRRNTFKRAVKAFKKEKELTKKYRLGYRAFMTAINERTEGSRASDTVRVHLEKGKAVTDFGELERVVERYCEIRYGGEEADVKDCELMGEFLESLKKS